MDTKARWVLWSRDLFDRESPPHRDLRGEGLVPGLAALWGRTAKQGIVDDGQRSFTSFLLEWGPTRAERAEVDVRTTGNEGLVRIRRWARDDLFTAIAEAHARLLAARDRKRAPATDPTTESVPILTAAHTAQSARAFLEHLRKLG